MIEVGISEIITMYLSSRAIYYDNGDGPTRHVSNIASGLRPIEREMGHLPLAALDGPALARLRDQWVQEGNLVRGTINRRISYAIAFVRWCVERGLASAEQLISVGTVDLIPRGRLWTMQRPKVKSAPRESVDRVLAELPPTIASMMELIHLTGMRPGEVRTMQLAQLKRMQHEGESVFKYTPRHKTEHLGKKRRIFIAGRAFDLVVERISSLAGETLFDPDTEGYLFSPCGTGKKPYAESSIPQAIRRARRRIGADDWTPNQLRHSYATERKRDGDQLELIADLLGHTEQATTLIYIDDDVLDESDDQAALEAAIRAAS